MQISSSTVFTRARLAFAVCALAGSLAVILSASSGSSAASSGTSTSSSSSWSAARDKFAACMRSHGVNVPDPSTMGGPMGPFGGAFRQAQQSPNFRAAIKACAPLHDKSFGSPGVTAAQRGKFQQDAVKFAQCMRAHNINVPDPTTNSAGGFGIFRSIPSGQLGSAAFKAAMTACAGTLPMGGHFGLGGYGAGRPF